MHALFALILGGLVTIAAYTLYAKRVDREVIQSDPRRATPARLYMDGVDFMPTSRNILWGYHFKSIAAAGPIVGPITAAPLWGWLPSLLWLMLGVSFIGWASDYSGIMVSVRNDGNTLSAIAHRLIAPRTRLVLLVFIFFYLLLVAGVFGWLVSDVLNSQTQAPFGILALMLMGLLGGQMLYRWRVDLLVTSAVIVLVTLVAILLGPTEVVRGSVKALNDGVNAITGGQPIVSYLDPWAINPQTGQLGVVRNVLPSFILWMAFTFLFCYLGSVLPIWRWAQPINYIGFWITAFTMVLGGLGAALAFFVAPEISSFKLPAFKEFAPVVQSGTARGIQPLWPMLFITIACGAISGWHALFGSVGTARQIENETDVLPVGGGAMLFGENMLGILSLLAVTTAGQGAGAAAFAGGIGRFLSIFGIPVEYGTALGFAAFVLIVITVLQLGFRVMRVALAELLGDRWPLFQNIHAATLISVAAAAFLVLTGVYLYLWQMFGAANQLMAALALLVVTVWLVSSGRSPLYAGLPGVFMLVTTMAAILVNIYNLVSSVVIPASGAGQFGMVAGAVVMIAIGALLEVAAILIAIDSFAAYRRYAARPMQPGPAPAAD